jgi:ryanodine receptor 2
VSATEELAIPGTEALVCFRGAAFQLEDEGFHLGDDLTNLERVSAAGAVEATVFHCARILEVLSRVEVEAATGERAATLYASLMRLSELGLLSGNRLAFFQTLRRLGNEVRHIHRRMRRADAEIAIALVERAMGWHFLACPVGPRVAAPEHADAKAAGEGARELTRLLSLLEDTATDAESLERLWQAGSERLAALSPVLPAMVAEQLIARGGRHTRSALAAIELGLESFPHDPRLRQLRGWSLRLTGDIDGAVEALEALALEMPHDPETLGLLAGTLKRLWADDARWEGRSAKKRRGLLTRIANLYNRAWKQSQESETYTGINAASMALLSGQHARARRVAEGILGLFERRRGRLGAAGGVAWTGYWDRVTAAEAELLLGNLDAARRAYAEAIALYPGRPTWHETTLNQLGLLLPALGVAAPAEAFLAAPSAEQRRLNREDEGGRPMYEPKPLDTSRVELPEDMVELRERVAEHVHDVWARGRMAEGWTWGPERDDDKKQHPCLVRYADLPESEKQVDRDTATETLKAIQLMGWKLRKE